MTQQTQPDFYKQPVKDGEVVFDAPWQAKSFAMAVILHEAGVFSWQEWADRLSEHIAAFESHSEINNSDDYYTLWQQTLEGLVAEKVTESATL